MYDHEDGFTELKIKKPNGIFTMSHETSTGMKINLGVTNTTINNAIEAINEFIILILINYFRSIRQINISYSYLF